MSDGSVRPESTEPNRTDGENVPPLDDLWDRADQFDDEGHGGIAMDLRRVLREYDPSRCALGHTPESCGCKLNRILWNVRGEDIDELVIHDVELVHVEQMDARSWWIGIYVDDGSPGGIRWSGFFQADSRGRMTFWQQDDEVEIHQDESHEDKATQSGRRPSDG